MENIDKQQKKHFDWLKEYQWQKGQSGNIKGRPKGKTLKEWGREFLMSMSEEARIKFVEEVGKAEFWKMCEGQPQQNTDLTTGGLPIPLLKNVRNNNSVTKDSSDDIQNTGSTGGDFSQ